MNKITKYIATHFAEWTATNCNVMPDGWSYKGEAYSTDELFDLFCIMFNYK